MRFFLNTVWRDTRCLVPPNRSKSNTNNSRGEITGWKTNCSPLLANWQQNSQEVTKDNKTHARTGHVPDVPGCYFDYPWALVDIAVRLPGRHGPAPAPQMNACVRKKSPNCWSRSTPLHEPEVAVPGAPMRALKPQPAVRSGGRGEGGMRVLGALTGLGRPSRKE